MRKKAQPLHKKIAPNPAHPRLLGSGGRPKNSVQQSFWKLNQKSSFYLPGSMRLFIADLPPISWGTMRYGRLFAGLCLLLQVGGGVCAHAADGGPVKLRYCVDPDWPPYEIINPKGEHEGIAADLLKMVAKRAGIQLELVPTRDWEDSLAAARGGRCQALSFLNSSPARQEWLSFTEPLLADPNVIVTREDHPYVADLAAEGAKTMVLPAGTSVEERVRRDFPRIAITVVESEAEAFAMVSAGKADMTLRSMSVAVFTIKKDGMFNLKVSGQVPGYENRLRVGLRKDAAEFVPALDRAIAGLTSDERRETLNRHVSITIKPPLDWRVVGAIATGVLLIVVILVQRVRLSVVARNRALSELTLEFRQRQEMERFLSMLTHELKRPMSVLRLLLGGAELPPRNRAFAEGAVMDMNRLLEHCLQVDRLDQGVVSVCRAECGVTEIVAEAAEATGLAERFRLDLDDDLVLMTDRTLLRSIMDNLFINATKYSPSDSPIGVTVRTEWRDDTPGIRFTVENACGPAGHPDPARVFQRYYRAPLASKTSGSGLGLYLVRGLSRSLGGETALVSSHPAMVRFDLWLPF
ncbi:MAG: transporter substrate-binding domain-containing protein [Alphaproteobacteria bacterium]|nr:transporter substrate-binding domain-containing protein [Alphaproteobacteria bacterium]